MHYYSMYYYATFDGNKKSILWYEFFRHFKMINNESVNSIKSYWCNQVFYEQSDIPLDTGIIVKANS